MTFQLMTAALAAGCRKVGYAPQDDFTHLHPELLPLDREEKGATNRLQ